MGLYEEMNNHKKLNKEDVFIDPNASTLHGIFGFDNVKDMEKHAMSGEYKKLGSLVAITTILAESPISTTLMLMAVLTAITKKDKDSFTSAGDLLQYLSDTLNEVEVVILAGKMVSTSLTLKANGRN